MGKAVEREKARREWEDAKRKRDALTATDRVAAAAEHERMKKVMDDWTEKKRRNRW